MRPVAPVLVDAKWISETVMAEPGQKERELTLMSRNGQLCEDFWAKKKRTIEEFDALRFEISFDREDDGVVLIVGCTIYSSERIDPWKLLDEAVQIPLEFHCTVPWLESKPTCCQLIE